MQANGTFWASVNVGSRAVHVGCWATERQAAIARDRAVLHLRLERPLNFPKASAKLGAADPRHLAHQARSDRKQKGHRTFASSYFGVLKDGDRFKGMVRIGAQRVSVGTFDSARHAAIARDRVLMHVIRTTQKKRAVNASPLNFPDDNLTPATVEQMRLWARKLEGKKHPHLNRDRKIAKNRYFGVYRRSTRREWWCASLKVNGKTLYLGAWLGIKKAALAHDRAALFYLEEPHELNFPRQVHLMVPADVATLQKEAHQEYKRTTSSRYRGVRWCARTERWSAYIQHKRRKYRLGDYDSESAAARAYDRAARELHGAKAKPNFQRTARKTATISTR